MGVGVPEMRVLLMAGAACLSLAACGAETPAVEEAPTPSVAVMPENDDPTERPPPAIDCKGIQDVIAAASEPVPFASLRTGNASLAGQEIADTFTTSAAPAGAKCQIGKIDASGAMPAIHVVNCTLFSSGMTDREKNAERAKQAFDAARTQFTACLPADWTARDGTSNETDSTESMIYESKADAQRAMTASFYTYPVKLMKEWVEEPSSGKAPGWHVTLDFQKDGKR
jgi:hypothetical protein